MKQVISDIRQEAAHDCDNREQEINEMSPKHRAGRKDPSRAKLPLVDELEIRVHQG